MQCVVLAGGLGTRMLPETATVPKALLPVAGRPFADWQLEWLASDGVTSVVYALGHLGEQIRDHVGDGRAFGLQVTYVFERGPLLGTGGALRLACDEGALEDAFLVVYGDSYLQVDIGEVWRRFGESHAPALMTVYRNEGMLDRSNVVFGEGRVIRYAKGLAEPPPEMLWIDYGLLAFARHAVIDGIPSGVRADLADLCARLSVDGVLAAFEARERFFEVGSVAGRRGLEAHLRAKGSSRRRANHGSGSPTTS